MRIDGTIQQPGRILNQPLSLTMWGAAAIVRPLSSAEMVRSASTLTAINELEELPRGLYGSPRASALVAVDRRPAMR